MVVARDTWARRREMENLPIAYGAIMRNKTRKLTAWDLAAIEQALEACLPGSPKPHIEPDGLATLLDKIRRATSGSVQVSIPQHDDMATAAIDAAEKLAQ